MTMAMDAEKEYTHKRHKKENIIWLTNWAFGSDEHDLGEERKHDRNLSHPEAPPGLPDRLLAPTCPWCLIKMRPFRISVPALDDARCLVLMNDADE